MSDVGSHSGSPAQRAPLPQYRGGERTVYNRAVTLGPENMVRGFISVESTPKPRALPTPPPKQQPEAFVRWGQAASFAGRSFRDDAKKVERWGSSYDPNSDDPEPLKRRRETYTEEGRNWEDVRVVNSLNPDDPYQYLIVREGYEIAVGGWYGDCRQPEKTSVDVYGNPLPSEAQFIFDMGRKSVGERMDIDQDPEYPPEIDELNEDNAWLDWRDRHSLGGGIG